MASVRKVLSEGTDADGNVARLSVDYDSVTLRLLAVRCLNLTAKPVFVSAMETSTGRVVPGSFDPSLIESVFNIPNNPVSRVFFTRILNGGRRLDGIEFSFMIPGS